MLAVYCQIYYELITL